MAIGPLPDALEPDFHCSPIGTTSTVFLVSLC